MNNFSIIIILLLASLWIGETASVAMMEGEEPSIIHSSNVRHKLKKNTKSSPSSDKTVPEIDEEIQIYDAHAASSPKEEIEIFEKKGINLTDLPSEILYEILVHCYPTDYEALSLVNRHLNEAVNNNEKGPFKELLAVRETYLRGARKLSLAQTDTQLNKYFIFLEELRQKSNIDFKIQQKSQLALQKLEHWRTIPFFNTFLKESPLEKSWYISYLSFSRYFKNLKTIGGFEEKESAKNPFYYWPQLALLRILMEENQEQKEQLEAKVSTLFYKKEMPLPFILLSSTADLLQAFDKLNDIIPDRSNKEIVAQEIAERGAKGVTKLIVHAQQKEAMFEWKEAARYYGLILKKERDLAALVYAEAANAYSQSGQWQRATELYEMAFQKEPDLPTNIYCCAGNCYYYLGKWQRILELCDQVFKKDPTPPLDIYFLRGTAYCYLKQWQRAVDFFELGFQKDSKVYPLVHSVAAHAYFELGLWQRVVELYDQFLSEENKKDYPIITYAKAGYAAAKFNQEEKALLYFKIY